MAANNSHPLSVRLWINKGREGPRRWLDTYLIWPTKIPCVALLFLLSILKHFYSNTYSDYFGIWKCFIQLCESEFLTFTYYLFLLYFYLAIRFFFLKGNPWTINKWSPNCSFLFERQGKWFICSHFFFFLFWGVTNFYLYFIFLYFCFSLSLIFTHFYYYFLLLF